MIKWSFYLLFFLVPLVFFSGSFELFEYNKMMLIYAFTIIIAGAWIVKRQPIKRTPFDIPIILYLASHILSTVFSIDPHTSVWGYYSRFHEGLIATLCYIVLYYAAVANLNKRDVAKILLFSFASGVIMSFWGTLEHFGASPSCLFITGKFDVSCWIQDVQGRVFATLGQPNWMAAYLDILILLLIGFISKNNIAITVQKQIAYHNNQSSSFERPPLSNMVNTLLFGLFFVALLFTKSRSGILGLIAGLSIFVIVNIFANRKSLNLKFLNIKPLIMLAASCFLLAVVFGLPFSQIDKFNLENFLSKKSTTETEVKPVDTGYIDIGISESGDIRKIVWEGALKIWQRYPIFGSGVETFAYAYYLDRPVAHNMVSEWDFLYNKAHNEFLNILATTGTVGMLAYLSIIFVFTWWFLKSKKDPLGVALFSAWISILVTNFFGFSVVIIGLFFFLIPAFSLILSRPETQSVQRKPNWLLIGIIGFIVFIGLTRLWNMWTADKSYAYGKNLDGVGQYTNAFTYLDSAVNQIPDESTYRDELSYNESVIALALFQQASGSAAEKLNVPYGNSDITAAALIQKAIADSNQTVQQSPNVLTFWKTRTKVFYQLATIDKQYLPEALSSIQKAVKLAPTDAKVHYNFALLLGQAGQIPQAIKIMEQTVAMKPNYADAYYALGLYYDGVGQKQKARAQMEYMLKRIGQDDRAKKWLSDNP